MSDKQRKILSAVVAATFFLALIAGSILLGMPLARLAEDPQVFQVWIDSFGIWSRLVFVALVTVQVIVAFIPGGPFELAAGYLYGVWEGSALCMAGFLLGSMFVFLLVRKFGMKLVRIFLAEKEIRELAFLKNTRKLKTLTFVLMVIPGTPKDALNYFAGLTRLKLTDWLLIMMVGRIPALVSTVLSGAAVGQENYLASIVIMILVAAASAGGILYYRHICKAEQSE